MFICSYIQEHPDAGCTCLHKILHSEIFDEEDGTSYCRCVDICDQVNDLVTCVEVSDG